MAAPSVAPGHRVQEALAVLDRASELVRGHGRDDLVERLARSRQRASTPSLRVLVVGEYKQGKSSLVNALLNANVCPVEDDIATAVPTIVRYAGQPEATAYLEPPEGDGPLEAVPVSVDDLPRYVTESGDAVARVRAAEVGLPRRLLAGGLELGDTPGVGGLGSTHTAVTLGALSFADAIVFVSDASQEYTAPELDFLRRARELCPTILCALSKTDLYPEWRRIVEFDAGHLQQLGLGPPVALSSPLRHIAVRAENAELNEESGFPALVAWLREVQAGSEQVLARSVVNDVVSVCDQVQQRLASERAAHADPAGAEELVANLTQARARADRLRGESAGWQQTLGDGVTDLTADADHDLRGRLREVARQAEEAIDETDPAQVWGELEAWLTRRVAAEAAECYGRVDAGARTLAERVTEHFRADEEAIAVPLEVEAPASLLATVEIRGDPRSGGSGATDSGLAAMRGAYGSVLMFSMLGRMVGLASVIVNPVTVVAGVLLGGKAIKDHRQRELTGRRQQAKQSARQYVDEVSFHVGKDLRDVLRSVHRRLRDTFADRAEELHRSAAEALAAAQQAVEADAAERRSRIAALDRELARLGAVRDAALALAPELRPQAAAAGR